MHPLLRVAASSRRVRLPARVGPGAARPSARRRQPRARRAAAPAARAGSVASAHSRNCSCAKTRGDSISIMASEAELRCGAITRHAHARCRLRAVGKRGRAHLRVWVGVRGLALVPFGPRRLTLARSLVCAACAPLCSRPTRAWRWPRRLTTPRRRWRRRSRRRGRRWCAAHASPPQLHSFAPAGPSTHPSQRGACACGAPCAHARARTHAGRGGGGGPTRGACSGGGSSTPRRRS
jgi:hypothetical protein